MFEYPPAPHSQIRFLRFGAKLAQTHINYVQSSMAYNVQLLRYVKKLSKAHPVAAAVRQTTSKQNSMAVRVNLDYMHLHL